MRARSHLDDETELAGGVRARRCNNRERGTFDLFTERRVGYVRPRTSS